MKQLQELIRLPTRHLDTSTKLFPGESLRDRARSREVLDLWADYRSRKLTREQWRICLAVHTALGCALGEYAYRPLPRMDDAKLINFRSMSANSLETLKKRDARHYAALVQKAEMFRAEEDKVNCQNISEAESLCDAMLTLDTAQAPEVGDFKREISILSRTYIAYHDGWKRDRGKKRTA